MKRNVFFALLLLFTCMSGVAQTAPASLFKEYKGTLTIAHKEGELTFSEDHDLTFELKGSGNSVSIVFKNFAYSDPKTGDQITMKAFTVEPLSITKVSDGVWGISKSSFAPIHFFPYTTTNVQKNWFVSMTSAHTALCRVNEDGNISLSFDIEGEARSLKCKIAGKAVTTGINGVTATPAAGRPVYFDLQGHRVAGPVKGRVYITDGKKVVF